jgi:N-acetylneuraminic acid mutarotase
MKKTVIHSAIILLCALVSQDAAASVSGWTQKANFGAEGRHRGIGMSIGNKGYMGLGHYNGAGPNIVKKDWWEYDPGTNSWTQRADYIGNNGNGNYAPMAFGMDQYGYIGGGQVGSDNNLYRYDPALNQWTLMGPMPMQYVNREGFVINNKGYAASTSTLFEYDPATNSWNQKNTLPFSLWSWNSTFVIDGKGYVKSGAALWEYKPLNDQWVSRAPFPGLASGGGASFSQNNKGYFVCGYDGSLSMVQREFWEFDPALNQWTQFPDFPGSKRRFCSAFSINGRSYFGIGTSGTNYNDLWEFNASQVFAGLDSHENEIQFSYGPNPSVDVVKFSSNELNDYSIRILSMSGEIITTLESKNAQCELHRNGLPSGTYLFEVIHENKSLLTKRFIFN